MPGFRAATKSGSAHQVIMNGPSYRPKNPTDKPAKTPTK